MSPDLRIWLSVLIAGGLVAGLGVADFVAHSFTLSTLDVSLVLAGAGAIGGKGAFDLGVQVPTPPK